MRRVAAACLPHNLLLGLGLLWSSVLVIVGRDFFETCLTVPHSRTVLRFKSFEAKSEHSFFFVDIDFRIQRALAKTKATTGHPTFSHNLLACTSCT